MRRLPIVLFGMDQLSLGSRHLPLPSNIHLSRILHLQERRLRHRRAPLPFMHLNPGHPMCRLRAATGYRRSGSHLWGKFPVDLRLCRIRSFPRGVAGKAHTPLCRTVIRSLQCGNEYDFCTLVFWLVYIIWHHAYPVAFSFSRICTSLYLPHLSYDTDEPSIPLTQPLGRRMA